MLGGVDIQPLSLPQHFARKRIDLGHTLDFVTEKFDAHRYILVGREYLQHIAAHAEAPTYEVCVVALILNLGQMP